MLGVIIDSYTIPLKGQMTLIFNSDRYAWNYGSLYFNFGPGAVADAITNINVDMYDEEGAPIDLNTFDHAFMQVNAVIDYDLSLVGINSGDNLIDFGISWNASDINEYTLGWFVFPYGVSAE